METAKMLELISVQRHDFLNHLQIISGLLQLKKEERARKYILEVGQDIKRLSKISHLKEPEAAAAFLIGYNQAVNAQILVDFNVQVDLAKCEVPGSLIGAVLSSLLEYLINLLAPPEVTERALNIDLLPVEGGYQFVFRFVCTTGANNMDMNNMIINLQRKLALYGGKVEVADDKVYQRIELFLPAADA